jgi:hypothetical protein
MKYFTSRYGNTILIKTYCNICAKETIVLEGRLACCNTQANPLIHEELEKALTDLELSKNNETE